MCNRTSHHNRHDANAPLSIEEDFCMTQQPRLNDSIRDHLVELLTALETAQTSLETAARLTAESPLRSHEGLSEQDAICWRLVVSLRTNRASEEVEHTLDYVGSLIEALEAHHA